METQNKKLQGKKKKKKAKQIKSRYNNTSNRQGGGRRSGTTSGSHWLACEDHAPANCCWEVGKSHRNDDL
jgi:hypothetical protein